MKIEKTGQDSLIVRYASVCSETLLEKIASDAIEARKIDEVIESVPSYTALWIRFDSGKISFEAMGERIGKICRNNAPLKRKNAPLHTIEADYTRGKDLSRVAKLTHMSEKEVVTLHSTQTYRIYTIGFLPGFAYLGILDPRLVLPRKRKLESVEAGAVAVAKDQTAIYPQKSPGGWYVIAYTDFKDYERFETGDFVRFQEI